MVSKLHLIIKWKRWLWWWAASYYKFIKLSNYQVIKLSNYQFIKLLNVQGSLNYQKMREIAVMRSSLQFSLIKIGFNWICNQTIQIYPSKFSFVQIILMELDLNVMKIDLIKIGFNWIWNQTIWIYPSKFSFVQIILMQLHLNVMKINLIEICFDWICNQTTLMFSFVQII